MIERIKYPRSSHLPWSEGVTDDDRIIDSVISFMGHDVVVTEKLDGENTTIYSDGHVHARSTDSMSHLSQAWVRALAGRIAHDIPASMRVCGENVYARHSIAYGALDTYFYVFGVFEGVMCLSWDDVATLSALLGLQAVPVLYRGVWDEPAVRACQTGVSRLGGAQEGYVVRLAAAFAIDEHHVSLAKFVRAGHVMTDAVHWKRAAIVPNRLVKHDDRH